jgi:hypothetical protein
MTWFAAPKPKRMAEFPEEVRTSPPSLLRSYGAAPASLKLHRGSPRRSFSEGGWRVAELESAHSG